jgi:hypothetical protein
MSNKFEKIRDKILNYNFTILSLDIGGGGIKIGVYKINPIVRIPLLVSRVKQFSIKGEKTYENVLKHFQKNIKNIEKVDFVCVSMSNIKKIFNKWRLMSNDNKNKLKNINFSKIFTENYGLKYFSKNDIFCHSVACRLSFGILGKKISSITFIFGTSPSLIIIDENGKEVEKSGGLVKNRDYLWSKHYFNKDFGTMSFKREPPKNNKNNSSLDNWNNENKHYFFKVWNKLLKPIFISGGDKNLNSWTGKPPRFIFITGGISQYRLAGYIGLMNNWLQQSSDKYKNTQILLGPRNSGLIGASCLPFI